MHPPPNPDPQTLLSTENLNDESSPCAARTPQSPVISPSKTGMKRVRSENVLNPSSPNTSRRLSKSAPTPTAGPSKTEQPPSSSPKSSKPDGSESIPVSRPSASSDATKGLPRRKRARISDAPSSILSSPPQLPTHASKRPKTEIANVMFSIRLNPSKLPKMSLNPSIVFATLRIATPISRRHSYQSSSTSKPNPPTSPPTVRPLPLLSSKLPSAIPPSTTLPSPSHPPKKSASLALPHRQALINKLVGRNAFD